MLNDEDYFACNKHSNSDGEEFHNIISPVSLQPIISDLESEYCRRPQNSSQS